MDYNRVSWTFANSKFFLEAFVYVPFRESVYIAYFPSCVMVIAMAMVSFLVLLLVHRWDLIHIISNVCSIPAVTDLISPLNEKHSRTCTIHIINPTIGTILLYSRPMIMFTDFFACITFYSNIWVGNINSVWIPYEV